MCVCVCLIKTEIKLVNVALCSYGQTSLLQDIPCLCILIAFSITVKAATLIFLSGCGSAISSAIVLSKMHSNEAILSFL